jgi:hypothetical protein
MNEFQIEAAVNAYFQRLNEYQQGRRNDITFTEDLAEEFGISSKALQQGIWQKNREVMQEMGGGETMTFEVYYLDSVVEKFMARQVSFEPERGLCVITTIEGDEVYVPLPHVRRFKRRVLPRSS